MCCSLGIVQELEDQALSVMQAVKAAEAVLAEKAEGLAAVKAACDKKQKEVQTHHVMSI